MHSIRICSNEHITARKGGRSFGFFAQHACIKESNEGGQSAGIAGLSLNSVMAYTIIQSIENPFPFCLGNDMSHKSIPTILCILPCIDHHGTLYVQRVLV